MADAAVSDEVMDDDFEEGEDEALESGSKKRLSGKKIVILFVLPVIVLAAVVGGLIFGGVINLGGGEAGHGEEQAAKKDQHPAVFHELPEMLVNLNTPGRRATFLKITVSLELEKAEDLPAIKAVMPRILDTFQVYLRELRLDDLRGSAGMYRLREELLARVNAASPVKVRDVLFKEMLVQ